MSDKYSYLIGDLVFVLAWILLFIFRKDSRKEMLVMSLIFTPIGLVAEVIFLKDWWRPLTIINSSIGLEDLLLGFALIGMTSVLYEGIFRKKKESIKSEKPKKQLLVLLIFTGIFLFLGSFYILGVHSFWAFSISSFGVTSIIWLKRKDLIVNSLVTGFLLVFISALVFAMVEKMTPGYVLKYWYFNKLIIDEVILGIPIIDLIWFFQLGILIGPFYEFCYKDVFGRSR